MICLNWVTLLAASEISDVMLVARSCSPTPALTESENLVII